MLRLTLVALVLMGGAGAGVVASGGVPALAQQTPVPPPQTPMPPQRRHCDHEQPPATS